jgi:hypothetical protein
MHWLDFEKLDFQNIKTKQSCDQFKEWLDLW